MARIQKAFRNDSRNGSHLTRRSFIKATTAATALAATGSLAACAPAADDLAATGEGGDATTHAAGPDLTTGEWKTAACWHNCGGRCLNKVLVRDGVVIHEGNLASLKRFKDDVKEVASGFECGLSIERFNDIKEGDILEAYTFEEVKRAL